MNLAREWMALGLQKTHDGLTDHATEHLLILQASQADGIEVAFEELENTQMRRKRVLSSLLLSKHQILVRRQQLDLRVQWINVSLKISNLDL